MRATFNPPARASGKILAFADVELPNGVIVKGFRIVDGENGVFAAVPSRSYVVDGRTRYSDQVSFADKQRRESFLDELMAAFGDWRAQKAG